MGDSARQPLHGDDRGVSETLGVVLLVGLTVVGTTLTVALGGGAIQDAQDTTEVESAQHAMTLFDARSALVALGDAGVQTVDLGRARGGAFDVREDEGWLRITHHNYSGASDEEVYNGSLGKLVYENGKTELAYQGGGVWRMDGNGSAQMVSPPEFHYRGATLTLPVIRVEGSTAGSGASRAVVRQSETRSRVFPNESASYPGGGSYRNPVESGSLTVTVHSAYYEGWASYFRARTDGNVTVDHENRTVTAELVAIGMQGDFGMPADGDAIEMRGLGDDHSLNNFTIVVRPDGDNADFANMDWSLDASAGSRTLNVSLAKNGGKICNSGNIDVRVSYDGPEGSHEWVRTSAFTENATDFAYSCAGGDPTLTINFTGTSNLTYDSGPSGMQFDDHASDTNATYDPGTGDAASVGYVVDHYVTLMGPTFDLEVDDFGNGNGNGNSGSVGEDISYGTLSYGGGGRVVTFLHVTENRVEVRIE